MKRIACQVSPPGSGVLPHLHQRIRCSRGHHQHQVPQHWGAHNPSTPPQLQKGVSEEQQTALPLVCAVHSSLSQPECCECSHLCGVHDFQCIYVLCVGCVRIYVLCVGYVRTYVLCVGYVRMYCMWSIYVRMYSV